MMNTSQEVQGHMPMRGKILVVEDEASVLENIVELLEAEGFTTLTARNGEEAFRLVTDEKPDLIISDIRLPRLDGKGLLSRLSRSNAIANIPFIFLTALTTREDQRAGMELGADDYITKPFTRKDLLDAVRRRLEKHRSIQAEAVKQTFSANRYLAQAMPFEMIQPLTRILRLADDLHKKRAALNGEAVSAAAQSIKSETESLMHTLDNYRVFYSVVVSHETDETQAEDTAISVSIKPLVEELAQSLFWEYQRQEELRLSIQDAEVSANEPVLSRVIEGLVRTILPNVQRGEGVEVEGDVFAGQSMYRLAICGPKTCLGEVQVSWLQHADAFTMEEYARVGINLILARKLLEAVHGGLSISYRDDGRLSLDIFLRLATGGMN